MKDLKRREKGREEEHKIGFDSRQESVAHAVYVATKPTLDPFHSFIHSFIHSFET